MEGRTGTEQRSKFYRNSLKGNLIKGKPSGQETQDKLKKDTKRNLQVLASKGLLDHVKYFVDEIP